ncbi:MAG: RCC1 domain-containing protein [Gemmatimonadales bacterium]
MALAACGDGATGPSSPASPTIRPATALAVGKQFTCLLTTVGESACWGFDSLGAVGAGTNTDSDVPVRTLGGAFVALSSTDNSVCGLDTSGRAWCWGELPGRSAGSSNVPVEQPAAATPLVSITTGLAYVCGLDAKGAAYCWGANSRGQLGVGDTIGRVTPTAVAPGTSFSSISTSIISTCAVAKNGAAFCWGSNQEGALGTGAAINAIAPLPAAVLGGQVFKSITAGAVDTCGLLADGTAYCWGTNQFGEGGQPPTGVTIGAPTAVATTLKFKSVVPARSNFIFQSTCGVASDGQAYCWGFNDHGQLGTPSGSKCQLSSPGFPTQVDCNPSPTPVPGLGPVETITSNFDHACAITVTKQVMCWGDDSRGQLGDGTLTARTTPGPIQGSFSLP